MFSSDKQTNCFIITFGNHIIAVRVRVFASHTVYPSRGYRRQPNPLRLLRVRDETAAAACRVVDGRIDVVHLHACSIFCSLEITISINDDDNSTWVRYNIKQYTAADANKRYSSFPQNKYYHNKTLHPRWSYVRIIVIINIVVRYELNRVARFSDFFSFSDLCVFLQCYNTRNSASQNCSYRYVLTQFNNNRLQSVDDDHLNHRRMYDASFYRKPLYDVAISSC